MGNFKQRRRLQLERTPLNFSIVRDRQTDIHSAQIEQCPRQRPGNVSQTADFDQWRRLGGQKQDLERCVFRFQCC